MMVPRTACPVCSSSAWRTDVIASRILALPSKYAIERCGSCGQRRLNPQLSPEEMRDLYSGAYFSAAASVSEQLPEVAPPPANYAAEVARERVRKFDMTLRHLRELHPSCRTLLDVGAATGDFVRLAQEHGYVATGIEKSEYAIRLALESSAVRLECAELRDLAGDAVYDFIHLNHVFEHFNEPLTELAHLRRLLKDGGLLYLEVPYQFQIIERIRFRIGRGRPELTLHSLHHAYFYTPYTISKLLKNNGFAVVAVSVFDPGRYPASSVREKMKGLAWQLLARAGIGNYIEVYARRLS